MDEKLTKDEKKALRQEEARTRAEKERKSGLMKTLTYWGIGALLVALALWALAAFSQGSTTSTNSSISLPAVTSADFQQGNSDSKATLVEYADFQCPACDAYYPVIKQLQSQFGEKLHFVYRFFPLETIHRNALNSAKAAYAANKQGKFWQMHDKLFDTQNDWAELPDPESTYLGYAKNIGLNTTQFKKDYESKDTETFVQNAYNADVAMGLNSTPTFFLNGKQIANPGTVQDFATLITNALK